jgi:hypothetical protein
VCTHEPLAGRVSESGAWQNQQTTTLRCPVRAPGAPRPMSAPPARRHAQRATPRRPRQVPPFEAIARGISGTGSLSSPPQHTLTQVLGLDGARGPIPPPVTKGGRQCPCRARPGGRGRGRGTEPSQIRSPAHHWSLCRDCQ